MMTLAIQNKEAKSIDNEDIFNSLCKKENGVNPFLTVMNFKISYKTWLKVARLQLDEIRTGTKVKAPHEANKRTVAVEIEYEESIMYTSEEDPEESLLRSATKSLESAGNLGGSIRVKKSGDPLAVFEKRM